jgi:hypothetical protein
MPGIGGAGVVLNFPADFIKGTLFPAAFGFSFYPGKMDYF